MVHGHVVIVVAMTLNPPLREALAAEMGDDTNLTARSSSGLMSPAELTLQRIHMQSSAGAQNKDAAKPTEPGLGLPAKGKPRLLLMGQRRYVVPCPGAISCPLTAMEEWEIIHLECRISQVASE